MTPEPQTLLKRFGDYVRAAVGLWYPPERHHELLRTAGQIAQERGFEHVDDCILDLMVSPASRETVEMLARHLAVGETYFFRDATMFSVLRLEILPRLLAARHESGSRTLRMLSAGCCSGEETYSLAMLTRDIPDIAHWDLRFVGIDINPVFLQAAQAGVYGEWSFRGVPANLRLRHFRGRNDGRYAVAEEARCGVEFRYMNLASGDYTVLSDLAPLDLVLCQNVLMYFGAQAWGHVAAMMHGLLRDDGWLCVSPVESDSSLYPQYLPEQFGGLTLYRKPARFAAGGH